MSQTIPLTHVLMEVSILVYAIGVIIRIARRSDFPVPLMDFAFAILFGFAVEWAFIQPDNPVPYSYGQFLLMIAKIPVWVSVGWGLIVFTAMRVTLAANVPLWLRPIACALLAINIDLSLDPIAHALGFWTWGNGSVPVPGYFGVPFDNFTGWIFIVGSFTLCMQIADNFVKQAMSDSHRQWLRVLVVAFLKNLIASACAAILAFVLVTGFTTLIQKLYNLEVFDVRLGEALVYNLLSGGALSLVVLTLRYTHSVGAPDWSAILLPVLVHSLMLFYYFELSPADTSQLAPMATLIPLLMVLGTFCFAWPSLKFFFPIITSETVRSPQENVS